MKARRLLPYLIAFLLLAWILGSLARSGTGGGRSILANSYWLVYMVELLPLIALGLIVVFIVSLVINWKVLSDALGSGMSRKRRARSKKSWKIQAIIWLATWTVAIVYLELKCHGLVCSTSNTAQATNVIENVVSGNGPIPTFPILGSALAFANLVDTNLFVAAFFAVLIVSSVILVRAVMVHLDEVRRQRVELVEMAHEQGREAVQAAMKVLDDNGADPRTRIVACYHKMVMAASDLGAPVRPDKTARELERAIRSMFLLNGPGIARLTGLFEEARYSLHPITEEDGDMARTCLAEISEELDSTVTRQA